MTSLNSRQAVEEATPKRSSAVECEQPWARRYKVIASWRSIGRCRFFEFSHFSNYYITNVVKDKIKVSRFTLSLFLKWLSVQLAYPCCHHTVSLISIGPLGLLSLTQQHDTAAANTLCFASSLSMNSSRTTWDLLRLKYGSSSWAFLDDFYALKNKNTPLPVAVLILMKPRLTLAPSHFWTQHLRFYFDDQHLNSHLSEK